MRKGVDLSLKVQEAEKQLIRSLDDRQAAVVSGIREIRTLVRSLSDQTKDQKLMRQMVLSGTEPDEKLPVHIALTLRHAAIRNLNLLPEDKQALLDAEKSSLDLIYFSVSKETYEEMLNTFLAKVEGMFPPVSQEQTDSYRSSGKESVQRVHEVLRKEGVDKLLFVQQVLEIVTDECGTWLDIALIREGTRMELGVHAPDVKEVEEVARNLFGDGSRVERMLVKFNKLSGVGGLEPVFALPFTIPSIVILPAVLIGNLFSDIRWDGKLVIALAVVSMVAVLGWITKLSIETYKDPPRGTRQALAKKYEDIEVPAEVQKFVNLMREINQDSHELGKLQVLIEEAKKLLQENRELFSETPLRGNYRRLPSEVIKEKKSNGPVRVSPEVQGESTESQQRPKFRVETQGDRGIIDAELEEVEVETNSAAKLYLGLKRK